jgi:DNA (cytosine-5)-methyltransferase 1
MEAAVKVISLFAGIGGFDLGFERAGMEVVAHVEIDPQCRKLLQSKWPNAIVLDDVREAGKHNLPEADIICGGFPCQDLSVAGKRAGLEGKRSGLFYEMTRITDELRPSFLVWENVPGLISSDGGKDFYRVITELDRIGYHGTWRTLDAQYLGVAQRRRRVFGCFARADIGAARCAEILSLSEGVRGHSPPSREKRERLAGTLTGGVGGGSSHGKKSGTDRPGFLTTDAGTYRWQNNDAGIVEDECSATLRAKGTGGPSGDEAQNLVPVAFSCKDHGADASDVSPTLRSMNHDESHMNGGGQVAVAFKPSHYTRDKDGAPSEITPPPSADADKGDQEAVVLIARESGQGYWMEDDKAGTLRAEGENRPSRPSNVVAFQPRYFTRDNKTGNAGSCGNVVPALSAQHAGGDSAPHVAVAGFKAGNGAKAQSIGYEEGVAPTMGSSPSGLNTAPTLHHGMQVRRLTPTECERLQGFPDGWTDGFSDSVRYRMLGNAVCVNVAEWIGRRIMNTSKENT